MSEQEWDALFALVAKVTGSPESALVKSLRLRDAAAARLADMDLYEFSALAALGEDLPRCAVVEGGK